jgi:hypothetical protein
MDIYGAYCPPVKQDSPSKVEIAGVLDLPAMLDYALVETA